MKLLLDENLPRKLKNFFGEQEVYTVKEMGWSEKTNGELLALLHPNGFDVLITSEKSLRFQQALQKYHAAVIILLANDNRLRTLKQLVPKVINALDFVKPGRNYSARQSVLSTECTTCNVNRLHNRPHPNLPLRGEGIRYLPLLGGDERGGLIECLITLLSI